MNTNPKDERSSQLGDSPASALDSHNAGVEAESFDPTHRPLLETPMIITLDGPSSAGKSTLAKILADKYEIPFLDSGAIYRSIAYLAINKNIPFRREAMLARIAHDLDIRFEHIAEGSREASDGRYLQRVWLGSQNVTHEIREPEISEGASRVSALGAVRAEVGLLERRIGEGGCAVEGRDSALVFPEARHKFYVFAPLEVRVARRLKQQVYGDPHAEVEDITAVSGFRELYKSIKDRDRRDKRRKHSPLREPSDPIYQDAIYIDTRSFRAEEVVQIMITAIDRKEAAYRRSLLELED